MEYRIGFTGKYYKLYEYNIIYREDYGKTYKYEHYKFVKVISMNKDKTIEKYPDVSFDEFCNDRKYSTFFKRTLVINDDKFHCGKYAGKNFDMCDDYDYLMWFYNACANDNQKSIIENILLNNDYIIIDNVMMSKEKINKENEKENRKNKSLEKLAKGLPFIVNFTANIHTDGTYFDKNLQITLRFERYRTSYWDDIYYGMPIDSNNKAKRIKGKQIMITKYTVDNDIVNILEWRFA